MEPVRMSDGVCIGNLSSAESSLQNFHYSDQFFSMMASSFTPDTGIQANGFYPFDPFCHGSSADFTVHESKTCEDNGSVDPAMLYLQDDGFLISPDWNNSLMESSYLLADDLGCQEDGKRRSISNVENNIDNESGSSLSTNCSRGPTKPMSARGLWSAEEDGLLIRLVEKYGPKWTKISHMLEGRVGKQCRERWHNHLRPNIKKGPWTEEEDRILVNMHQQVGNRWTEIAENLPGRPENAIKNHWNAARRMQKTRRKCSTKWPEPSSILTNYISSLCSENESNSRSRNMPPPPNPVSTLQIPETGHCPNAGMLPEYEINDVLKFAYDDYHVSDMDTWMSFLNDGTPIQVPPEIDTVLPVDMPPLMQHEWNIGSGSFHGNA